MVPSEKANAGPYLKRLAEDANPTFTTPAKRINDGDDLTFFFTSTAYRDFMIWILQLNHSMFSGRGPDGSIRVHALDTPQFYSSSVQSLRSLTFELQDLIQKAPPDTGPRRFGNVAFRTWFKLAEGSADSLLEKYLGDVLQKWGVQSSGKRADLKEELKTYLLGSFGSAQRLDYGTGHELSYLAFLGCLWKLGLFEDGEERAIVVGLIQPCV